mgnify:CR=1 FL=1
MKLRIPYGKINEVDHRRCNCEHFTDCIDGYFVIDCIGLTVVVLMQEGKQKGLGAISGMADSYWGQNKGRSMEGHLVLATKIMAILFMVLAIVLNMNF